jgi:transposase
VDSGVDRPEQPPRDDLRGMTSDASVTLTPRQQHRLAILTRLVAGHCTALEAAQLLSVSERTVWRLKAAYQQHGAAALIHGNRDRPKPWALTDELRNRVRSLVAERYAACNDAHLTELLAREHQIFLSRASVRRILRSGGSPAPHPRRAPRHRRRRDRFAQAGMLLQIDGSPHQWFGPDQPRCTLLAAIDDATSRVVAAVFRAQEDAHGYFLLVRQVLTTHGIPEALYHDRHGIFLRNPLDRWTLNEELAGAKDPTQFGRALVDLGIGSIAARSPQAKGRIERLWGTLQDRLVVELRLAGITSPDAVTADFLTTYFDRHNASFAVPPNDPGSAYRPLPPTLDLERLLSFRYGRVVNHDNTVQFNSQVFQIPPGPRGRGYAKARVWVHELLDGALGVWHAKEQRWLLRSDPSATPVTRRARSAKPPQDDAAPQLTTAPSHDTSPHPSSPTRAPWRPAANHPWRR